MTPEWCDYAGRMATEFDADLRLLPTASGGRVTAMQSGYRSIVRLGGAEGEAWGVEITVGGRAKLAPGESAHVQMRAWADLPRPTPGTVIWLYEGARLVGTGTVRE